MRNKNIKLGDIVECDGEYAFIMEINVNGYVKLSNFNSTKSELHKLNLDCRIKTNKHNTIVNIIYNNILYSFEENADVQICDKPENKKPFSFGIPRTHKSIPENIKAKFVSILNNNQGTQVSR